MAHVYLGVIIVGMILTMKVVMDSLKALGDIQLEIDRARAGTIACQGEINTAEQENADKQRQVSQLQKEVEELVQKEKDMDKEIKDLRTALDGPQKFKLDL